MGKGVMSLEALRRPIEITDLDGDTHIDLSEMQTASIKARPLVPSDIFGEDIEAGTVPELDENIDIFVALENQIATLECLHRDIVSGGGMNQQLAIESFRLIPGYEEQAPLNFYSEEMTVTRYRVTLEAIGSKISTLIAAAVAAMVAMIRRIIRWISGDKDGNGKIGTETSKALKQIDAEVRDLRQTRQVMSAAFDNARSIASRETSEPMFQLNDPVSKDIVDKGRYTTAVLNMITAIRVANSAIETKFVALTKLMEKGSGSAKFTQVVSEPLRVPFDGARLTLSEMAEKITMIRVSLEDHQHVHKQPLKHAARVVMRTLEDQKLDHLLSEIAEHVKIYQRNESFINFLESSAPAGAGENESDEHGRLIRASINALSADIVGYNRLIDESRTFMRAVGRLRDHVVRACRQANTAIKKKLENVDEQGLATHQKTIDRLEDEIKILRNEQIFRMV